MMPSTSFGLKETLFDSNDNILEETQRLIEEAEVKLRSMEAGIIESRGNVCSSFDEYHSSSYDSKNHQLRLALDNKMRKLERQLDTHWKKQISANNNDASVDPSGTSSVVLQNGKRPQRSRFRRSCRRTSEAERGPQDVADVVRTARDSVQGALVAARELSASLDNRTPRDRASHRSASASSPRQANDPQAFESESAHLCLEHATKRKVCSCLRLDVQGSKSEEKKDIVKKEKIETSPEVPKFAPRNANIGIFKATATVKEVNRPSRKRLQVSVMPALSIKRSLEKFVMPAIQVPFPGSIVEVDKRENTGVRNFKYDEPTEFRPSNHSCTVIHQDRCEELSGSRRTLSVPVVDSSETIGTRSATVPQISSLEGLKDLDPSQLKQLLEFLVEKVSLSQNIADSTSPLLSAGGDPIPLKESDRSNDAGQQNEKSSGDCSGSETSAGSVAYNSLSRFLQTYSKAAVESKRAKQKAGERRKEEEKAMRAEEQRFKNSSSANQSEANQLLIGPLRRAILKGNLRKNSNTLPVASGSSSDIEARDAIQASVPKQLTVNSHSELNSKDEGRFELNVTRLIEPQVPSKNLHSLKNTQNLEEQRDRSESEEKNDSESSVRSEERDVSAEHPESSSKAVSGLEELSSNDEYEDDWEEENEGDKILEGHVETRDVGDGGESDTLDEVTGGLAHTLRTIVEVEENSSLSMSLVEGGANKCENQPASKSVLTETNEMKILAPSNQLGNDSFNRLPSRTEPSQPTGQFVSAEVQTVALDDHSKTDEFSSRAFLEMTESLKKMLESVVTNLVANKPCEGAPVRDDSRPKNLSVRFESGLKSRSFRKYDPTSSGSPNDDRVSSGSESSPLYSRNPRWRPQARRPGRVPVRFKSGIKRSSGTQTEVDNGFDVWRRDVETQVTPVKDNEGKSYQGWSIPENLFLRPSRLSLERPVLAFDVDPTERLLAFGKSLSSYPIQGPSASRGGGTSSGQFLSHQPDRGSVSVSQCESLSSSSSSVLPLDGSEYPANNTIVSLSEGEVLAYHSCSCSEGEICLCAEKYRRGRGNLDVNCWNRISSGAGDVPVTNPRSLLDSTAPDELLDLSDHFSEGEIIEKLIGISHLLNKTPNEYRDGLNSSGLNEVP